MVQDAVVVGHHDRRDLMGSGFLGEKLDDVPAAPMIKRRGGFVDQEHGGAGHEGPGDADPLALAAGKLMRAMAGAVTEPDRLAETRARGAERAGAVAPAR